jgi:hypothetical protein
MLDSLAVRGSRAHAGFWRDCETSYAAAPYKNNAIAASQCAEACDVGCGVNMRHAGPLVGTAEVPHIPDRIAAAPNASPLCQFLT